MPPSVRYKPLRGLLAVWAATFSLVYSADRVVADVVRLANGGRLYGKVVSQDSTPDPSSDETLGVLRIRTVTGALVEVIRSEVVDVQTRSLVREQYELQRACAADTVEEHLRLATWCQQHGLEAERAEELRRVLELDPNNQVAHRALKHVRYDGRWVTRDEYDRLMRENGYVLYKGRYLTRQELELLQQKERLTARQQQWFPKIRIWHRWLTGRRADRRAEALARLREVRDPAALRALQQFLGRDRRSSVRALLVEILAQMDAAPAHALLTTLALQDPDEQVRQAAVRAIPESYLPTARARFRAALGSQDNRLVRRAGAALAEVGTQEDVPALIAALVTTHAYKVRVPTYSNTYGFSTDGSFSIGGAPLTTPLPPDVELALRTGQLPYGVLVQPDPVLRAHQRTKVVTVRVRLQNPEVLVALQKLTGKDFGYEERIWQRWWVAQKQSSAFPLN